MEKQNRTGVILLILAGFALVLCAGMVIGGAAVYGALRMGDYLSSRAEQEKEPEVWLEETYEEFSLPSLASGALLVEVLPGTPAEEAGLQAGERIVAVDSRQVGPDGTLAELIARYEPGDRITLEVQAVDGSSRKVRVTLGENPNAAGEPFLGVYSRSTTMRDLPLEEMLPFSEEGESQLDELPMPGILDGAGIVIVSVVEGSPAADAGLQHGDTITSIDGEQLDSAMALTEAIAGHEPGDRITLGVLHAGDDVEVQLRVRLGEHPEEPGRAYLGVMLSDLHRQFRFHGSSGDVEDVPTPPLP